MSQNFIHDGLDYTVELKALRLPIRDIRQTQ